MLDIFTVCHRFTLPLALMAMLMAILLGALLSSSAGYADSGSSQAIMALIVPPQDMMNVPDPAQDQSKLPQPFYNHDYQMHFMQQDGTQVWVTL